MKKLMSANWKMYKTLGQATDTARELAAALGELPADREVLVFPPFTAIAGVAGAFAGRAGFSVGGQDLYPAAEGAFTGEIAPAMLLDLGCTWALTGHSERRHVLGEANEFVGAKTAFALDAGLNVCLCIGETIEERRAGRLEEVLTGHLAAGLADVAKDIGPERLAVAYEPVWAIGTGEVAGPADILAAHAYVRAELEKLLPSHGAEIRILYGGSVKPENTGEIISLDNVGGVLVGGASLQASSFSRIVTA
ncbi:MAG: triose-phosphate isomerase [Desulfovibrionaceae bacterium]|jgi:triosephosphate isomerase|nr:triose-phosphate isomerase [Desulfovibrionaceae bacterium]